MDKKSNGKGAAEKPIVDTPGTAELSVAETSIYSESTIDPRQANNNNAMVPATVAPPRDESVLLQRTILNNQVFVFGIASAVSFAAFLALSLPFSALVAFMMFVSSTMTLFYMAYRIILLEINQILQGRGIGDYLPASIYQQLTTTSLHEWMMDGSFFLENRYLLLYFIPGITQEQLDSYLERLPARHQYVLTRPGLGQFLGSDFMRVIMGQSRYNDLLLEDQREEQIIENGASRRLFENEDDSSGDGVAEPRSVARRQAPPQDDESSMQMPEVVAPQPISTDPADVPEEELQQEYNEESDILTEAVAAMTTSYSTMITDTIAGYTIQAVNYVSPFIIGGGMTVSLGALGVGIWGYWAGVYHPSRSALHPPHFPSSRSLLSAAFAGVSSAGVMLLFRGAVRSAIKKDRKTGPSGEDKKSD